VVGKCHNLERALSLQNVLHLPTTQCACADFCNFAKQRNGGSGHEKDLLFKLLYVPWPGSNLLTDPLRIVSQAC
jgi:hypothetical protein